MMSYELQQRTNNGYDTILAVRNGVVWAEWQTTGDDEHMANFRAGDNVADWGCWDDPQTAAAEETPNPDDWGRLVSSRS